MKRRRQAAVVVVAAAFLVGLFSAYAGAAEFVVVTAARGPIRTEATSKSLLVTTVEKGTRLEVVAKAGDWYRVLLPPDKQGTRLAGYIQASLVAPETGGATGRVPPSTAGRGTGRPAVAAKQPPRYTFRGFGSVEYEFFQARNSFDAIFQSSTGLLYGGGAEVAIGPHWFVQGRLSYFTKTGERAFVSDGEVSRLGIAETVSMMPFDASVGYRVISKAGFMPYVAGGIGSLSYDESSESGGSGNNNQGTFFSYHVAGGVEVPIVKKWLGVAGEFQYRGVPGAIGEGGVSKQFNETNLGGMSLCVKFLVGRQPARTAGPPKPASPPKPPAPKR